MKLGTLNYIHSLLITKEEVTLAEKRRIYKAREEAKGDEDYKILCTLEDEARQAWYAARNALEDFENQNW